MDCSILSAESLARAVHGALSHARLLHDAAVELRKQLIRRHRNLAPARFLGLGLVSVLVPAATSLGGGGALHLARSDGGAGGGGADTPSAAAIGALLGEIGIPAGVMRGVAVISRSAGLVAHIAEEQRSPSMRYMWELVEEAVPYVDNPEAGD